MPRPVNEQGVFLLKVLTLMLIASFLLFGETTRAKTENTKVNCPNVIKGIGFYRERTWSYQDKMGSHRIRSVFAERHSRSCAFNQWSASLWRARARKAHRRYVNFVKEQRQRFNYLYAKWSCIHRYEGSWTANTGNGYFGGLQEDWGFMRTYGPEFLARYGTADKWPVIDQLIAAERAYQSGRGYTPWPFTARLCGLI